VGAEACNLAESILEAKKPPVGETMTPWVKVTFKVSGVSITVGNRSSDANNNHAVIKDFEYGNSDGAKCRITIIDEQGSNFVQFMDDMLKDFKCATPAGGYTMDVQFGWAVAKCSGALTVSNDNNNVSPIFTFMCEDVFCNTSGGKFVFEIGGTDITAIQFDGRISKVYGEGVGDKGMFLTDAIRQMLQDNTYPPTVASVRFLKPNGNHPMPLRWDTAGCSIDAEKGPKGKWVANNLSKLDAAHSWLKDYLSENGKSIRGAYNNLVPGGEVIFWEDPRPNCGEFVDWDQFKLGTYIVNGGKESSVIDFNQKIQWNFSSLTNAGGNMGDNQVASNQDGSKQPGMPGCPDLQRARLPGVGSQTSGAADENALANYGKQANQKVMEAQAKQQKALQLFHYGVEAEMTVVGDPRVPQPMYCPWRNIHIIYINPFYIIGGSSDNNSCGDWLAKPKCNPVLSNKNWQIKSLSHRISDGKFTTSFQIFLVVPGVDVALDDPLGGLGSGGWTPNNKC
jgi:hypothetical protein